MLMLNAPQRDLLRDKGTIFGRGLIGLLFVVTGSNMLLNSTETVGYMASLGIPLAGLVIWLVIVLKIVAGSAIIIGKRVGLASSALIGFTILSTLVAHVGLGGGSFETVAVFKNLAIVGGLLYLMSYGPGGSNTRLVSTDADKNGDGIADIMQ